MHPSVLLKIYIYRYPNRVASSRRLERERLRNADVLSNRPRYRFRLDQHNVSRDFATTNTH